MKTKSFIIVFIIALIVIILLTPKNQTPYSGSYHAVGSTNENLILNSDNSFDLHIDNYRNSMTIRGKYKILNNHIELLANDKYSTLFIKDITSGDVTGSVITFKQVENTPPIIFTKS